MKTKGYSHWKVSEDDSNSVSLKLIDSSTLILRVLKDALNVLSALEEREIEECLKELDSLKPQAKIDELKDEVKDDAKVEDTKVELKVLPSHLKYVFLENDGAKPVIISSSLSDKEENKLVEILKSNKEAMGWTLSDLKGISPSYCMHKIIMEDNYKSIAQAHADRIQQ